MNVVRTSRVDQLILGIEVTVLSGKRHIGSFVFSRINSSGEEAL